MSYMIDELERLLPLSSGEARVRYALRVIRDGGHCQGGCISIRRLTSDARRKTDTHICNRRFRNHGSQQRNKNHPSDHLSSIDN